MKRRIFFLFFSLVFLVGCAGRLLLRPSEKEEIHPFRVTLVTEKLDNFLLSALPMEGDTVQVAGESGSVYALEYTPCRLWGRDGEGTHQRDSLLFSKLTVELIVFAKEREGRLYLGDRCMPLGETVQITSPGLCFSARISAFSPAFCRKSS